MERSPTTPSGSEDPERPVAAPVAPRAGGARKGRRASAAVRRPGAGRTARLGRLGADRLETAELLELLLGRSRRAVDSVSNLERPPETRPDTRQTEGVRSVPDLIELSRASCAELVEAHGLSAAAAARLEAAFALGRRLESHRRAPRRPLRSAERVFRLLDRELRGRTQETFIALLLDGKHALQRQVEVSLGTLTSSLVHPREVFRLAVREAAAAVICAHNHPSGDPEPSPEDLTVTRRLVRAGRLLGIPLLDHVVVGDGRYVSLRDRMPF